MRFRVELFPDVVVQDLETRQTLALRSYRGIISAIGFSERPVSREELIENVWPDVSLAVGRNRLRVALAKLRQLLPGGIVESASGLEFDGSVVWLDAAAARKAVERSSDNVTRLGEYEALKEALDDFIASTLVDHRLPGASQFCEFIATSFLRLVELAHDHGDKLVAKDAAAAATLWDPNRLDSWTRYLLASWQVGSAEWAIEDALQRAPKRIMGDSNFKSTRKLVLAKNPGAQDKGAAEENAFWLDVIEAIRTARPDLMRSVLSSPQTLALSGKRPRLMHDALQLATPLDCEEKDSVWDRCVARMIGLKAWLGDAQGVLDCAPILLESTREVQILRATWNSVAVAHSLLRQWDEAYLALDRTLDFAREMDSEIYQVATIGNGAFFKMQQARFDEADEDYRSILERYEAIGTPQAQFESAVATGNRALIAVFQGDWNKALADLEHAIDIRSRRGLTVQMGILLGCLAMVRAQLGKRETVVALTKQAFLDAFESDSFRTEQFTFELAAVTVESLGDSVFAKSLADWTQEWRSRTQAPRSPAEKLLVAHVSQGVTTVPISPDPSIAGKETIKRLRALVAGAIFEDSLKWRG